MGGDQAQMYTFQNKHTNKPSWRRMTPCSSNTILTVSKKHQQCTVGRGRVRQEILYLVQRSKALLKVDGGGGKGKTLQHLRPNTKHRIVTAQSRGISSLQCTEGNYSNNKIKISSLSDQTVQYPTLTVCQKQRGVHVHLPCFYYYSTRDV